jgi:hypothetical protein
MRRNKIKYLSMYTAQVKKKNNNKIQKQSGIFSRKFKHFFEGVLRDALKATVKVFKKK